jgi:hypothetical protein
MTETPTLVAGKAGGCGVCAGKVEKSQIGKDPLGFGIIPLAQVIFLFFFPTKGAASIYVANMILFPMVLALEDVAFAAEPAIAFTKSACVRKFAGIGQQQKMTLWTFLLKLWPHLTVTE